MSVERPTTIAGARQVAALLLIAVVVVIVVLDVIADEYEVMGRVLLDRPTAPRPSVGEGRHP